MELDSFFVSIYAYAVRRPSAGTRADIRSPKVSWCSFKVFQVHFCFRWLRKKSAITRHKVSHIMWLYCSFTSTTLLASSRHQLLHLSSNSSGSTGTSESCQIEDCARKYRKTLFSFIRAKSLSCFYESLSGNLRYRKIVAATITTV